MTSRPPLKERLQRQPEAEQSTRAEEPPSTEVTPNHAANTRNRRHECEMLKVHYGKAASIALPYAYLGAIDSPEPGKIVLEFATRIVTIEGLRLDAVMTGLIGRQLALLRETDHPPFANSGEPCITKITVRTPGENE